VIYTQIRAFDAVAHAGSFSGAAKALGVTQPALTIQVKALEEHYGVKLLERQGRGVTLTAMGTQLFRMSRQMAGLEERIRETLAGAEAFRGGHLRLAADGPHIVMGLLNRFLGRYPNVRLSVAMGNTQFVRQQLLERRVDVAVLPSVKEHPQIHAQLLWKHKAVLIVAATHPWAGRRSVALETLDGEPMIAREEGSMTQRIVDDALARAGVKPKTVLQLGSREAICEAVSAGLGHSVIWELEAYGSTRFRTIPFRNVTMESTDFVACLKSERTRQLVAAFFQVAATLPGNRSDIRTLRR
jgi:aminoethylphosphonate catabolism LysR family transcriptional regulator